MSYRKYWAVAEFVFVTALSLFILAIFPETTWRLSLPVGADLAGHYYPLINLIEQWKSGLGYPLWNPGNYYGELQLVGYFPLPFFIMALLGSVGVSPVFLLRAAVVLPCLLTPWVALFTARSLGVRGIGALCAALLSVPLVVNPLNHLWGGGIRSQVVGEFCHGWSLIFLLLWIGVVATELRDNRAPRLSAILMAAAVCSHIYVALGIPFLVLMFVLGGVRSSRIARLRFFLHECSYALALSLWFIIPFVDLHRFGALIPYWDDVGLQGLLPPVLYPTVLLFIFALALRYRARSSHSTYSEMVIHPGWWVIPCAWYVALFFALPYLGASDVRAVPQLHLFLVLAVAQFCSGPIERIASTSRLHGTSAIALFGGCAMGTLVWVNSNAAELSDIARTVLGGVESRFGQRDLARLMNRLKGNLAEPRVLFDWSALDAAAGGRHTDELLPYYVGRASATGLYAESNLLSLITLDIAARIGRAPRKPTSRIQVRPLRLPRNGRHLFPLLGIGALVIANPYAIPEARHTRYLRERGGFAVWNLFELARQPKMVEVISNIRSGVPLERWRFRVRRWLKSYRPSSERFILGDALTLSPQRPDFDIRTCTPQIHLGPNQIRLTTNCVGQLHVIKFAYLPVWRADSGDEVRMVSPNFIAIIPSRPTVVLNIIAPPIWEGSFVISGIALIVCTLISIWSIASATKRRALAYMAALLCAFILSSLPRSVVAEEESVDCSGYPALWGEIDGDQVLLQGHAEVGITSSVPASLVFPKIFRGRWDWQGKGVALDGATDQRWEISERVQASDLEIDPRLPGVYPISFEAWCVGNPKGLSYLQNIVRIYVGADESRRVVYGQSSSLIEIAPFVANHEHGEIAISVKREFLEGQQASVRVVAPQTILVQPQGSLALPSRGALRYTVQMIGDGLDEVHTLRAILQWNEGGEHFTDVKRFQVRFPRWSRVPTIFTVGLLLTVIFAGFYATRAP